MRELKGKTDEFFRQNDSQHEAKSIEQQNVETVELMYRAIEKGDVDGFRNKLADSIELEIVGPDRIPFTGSAKGRDQVIEFVMSNFNQLEEQRANILEVIAQGDSVVVFGCESGRFRDSGREYEMNWVQRFKIRNNSIVAIRQVFDTAAMPG